MRVETTHTNLYKYNELSDSVKATVLGNQYYINVEDYDWWDSVYEDFDQICEILGVSATNKYFSGFSSQGDGACFEGHYSYAKGAAKKIREFAPLDKRLHLIADNLQEIQRINFYQLNVIVKHSGHYYHEYCTNFVIERDSDVYQDMAEGTEDRLIEELRNLMRWLYSTLSKQYDYLTSEEAIKETIESNEYEFDDSGELH